MTPVSYRRWLTIACVSCVVACGLPAAAGASVGVGDISTFAGSPVFGPVSALSIGAAGGTTGDIATATLDGTQYAYYAGYSQNVVRRIDLTTDEQQVVAGNGGFGAAVSGSLATTTTVGPADSVSVDAKGDMAILGEGQAVWFVPANSGTYFGEAMTAGDIYHLPVTAETIALEPNGSLVYDYDGVIGVDPVNTGAPAVLASGDIDNLSIAADPAHPGNFAYVVGETGSGKAGHEIDYYAAQAGAFFGISMSQGVNSLVDASNEGGYGVDSGDGGPANNAIVNPGVIASQSLTFDAAGDLLILDSGQDGAHDGQQRLVAATSCASSCLFGLPATTAGYIYRTELPFDAVDVAGDEEVLAGEGLAGIVRYSSNAIDEGAILGNGSYGYDGEGVEGASAQFGEVNWVASDADGDVAIVDGPDSRVRFIPAGSGTYFGRSMTGGDIYTIAGNGIPGGFLGGGGNGGSATAAGATFSTFSNGAGVALDPSGDLVLADETANEVRFVPAQSGTYFGKAMLAGDVYEIAGPSQLSGPTDVALDAAGDVLVADNGHDDVKEIAAGTGAVSTVVPASANPEPYGIAVDAHGDIALTNDYDSVSFIPSSTGSFYGQSMTAGAVYKIAGDGTEGYSGDGASATSAELAAPDGLAFDSAGDLIVAQRGSGAMFQENAVRFLPAGNGTFYGQPMTVGDIYTIAGNGTQAFRGDGGPGASAELAVPTSVAMMPGEDVLIADSFDNRVRVISGSVPTAKTGAAGSATATSDSVEGSVDPQGRPIGYTFEYGTTTAYGASTADSAVGSDHAEHPESQTLQSLTPGTVYHYRIAAEYDEAGATISVPGADATFTTEAAASTGANTESTGATTTSTTTVAVAAVGASASQASAQLLHGCSSSPLVLNDAYIHAGRVALEGSAAKSDVGQKVKILFNERKQVASAVVKADGQYTTTAPLPPAKIRNAVSTRYSAELGKVRSLHLKLTRRLQLDPPTAAGASVTLTGEVTPPLTKPVAPVLVEEQLECGKTTIAKTFTPPASGRFDITIPVPATARAAIFQLKSKVAANAHATRHGFTTYSLPLPVALDG